MDKEPIRQAVWDELDERGIARFPFPPHGRIPNVEDAATAADRLQTTDAWAAAETIKANPDAPQLPVRRAALRAGKTLYMAVPRLREEAWFLELDPAVIEDIDHATTVGGSSEVGVPVTPESMPVIDLIVSGSVAVDERQVRESVPSDGHDVPLDLVVTPERTIETETQRPKPDGIDWDTLDAETIAEIPILQRLDSA